MEEQTVIGPHGDCEKATRVLWDIHRDWVDSERELMTAKWFDYRFLNPVEATYIYAHEFVKAYRLAYRGNIDARAAEYIKPIANGDLFDLPKDDKAATRRKMLISGLWRGRQVADMMGMPYDVYLQLAFFWTLRYWRQRHLPRPHQLYTQLVYDRAKIDWEKLRETKLFFGTHEAYRNDRYCGLASQDDHHEWLIGEAAKRGDGEDVLASFVYRLQILPIEKVEAKCSPDVTERVLAGSNRILH